MTVDGDIGVSWARLGEPRWRGEECPGGRGGEEVEVVMEERGGREGWTLRELSPGRADPTLPPVGSLAQKKPSHTISVSGNS